jgi:hypothetical protein
MPSTMGGTPRKRRTGLIVTAVIAAVLVVVFAGAIFGASRRNNNAARYANQNPSPAPTSATVTGEPVRDGTFQFTVRSTTCGNRAIGSAPFTQHAKGEFCTVKMDVRNVGNRQQLLDASSQKAFGAGGQMFTPSQPAVVAANRDNRAFLGQIRPGRQVSGVVVYDVPPSTDLKAIELHESPFTAGVRAPLT